ncbi:MAG: GNAT family N-acetyltransferase [Anaerolineales bacterium]|nr:GNAT family N-acetyltransferase [Anaerolineales bacterium]
MRLLYLTHAYPPNSTGGTELSTHAIAKSMAGAGHEVEVLCADRWGEGPAYWNGESKDVLDGVKITRLLLNWQLSPDPNRYLYDNPETAAYLEKFLATYRPDLVHVTSCVTLSSSILATVSALGIPLVISLTDFWFICPQIKLIKGNGELCDGQVEPVECLKCMLWDAKAYRWPKKILPETGVNRLLEGISQQPALTRRPGLRGMAFDMPERRALLSSRLATCDRILVKSDYVKNIFLAHGAPAKKITLLPDGEDSTWKDRLPKRSPGNPTLPSSLRIGYLGHIVPVKGVHVLLDAFQTGFGNPGSAVSLGNATLRVYGDLAHDPSYTKILESQAASDPRIQLCGKYTRDQLPEIMAGLDVLVVPSIWPETFNHVIREGFIAGIPVIGSDLGAIPEAIEPGVNGYLFPAGDSQELARLLGELANHPERLDRLRANIPPVKTIEQQTEELEALYQAEIQEKQALKQYLIRDTTPQDSPDLIQFASQAFQADWTPEFVAWKYFQNPAGRFYGKVAEHTNSISSSDPDEFQTRPLGFYGNLPVGMKFGPTTALGAQAVDAMIAPEARRLGLFVKLNQQTYQDMDRDGIILDYALPNPVSQAGFIKRLGWKTVGQVPRFTKYLRFSRKPGLRNRSGRRFARELEIRQAAHFDPQIDLLWQEAASRFSIAVLRDHTYLNWRYTENPQKHYLLLEAWRGDRLTGIAVLSFKDLSRHHSVALAEWLFLPKDTASGKALLAAAEAQARLRGAEQLHCWMLPAQQDGCRLLRHAGYFFFDASHGFTALKKRLPGSLRYTTPFIIRTLPGADLVPDPGQLENWYLSMGDHDYY